MDLTFKPIRMIETNAVGSDAIDQKTRVLVFAVPVTVQVELPTSDAQYLFLFRLYITDFYSYFRIAPQ
jgi:hypothetical protein